jgi:hypothetical protein
VWITFFGSTSSRDLRFLEPGMAAESDIMSSGSDVGAGGDETGKGGSRGVIGAAVTGGTNTGTFACSEKMLKLVDASPPTPESNSN